MADTENLKELTADIVAAHIGHNHVAAAELPNLIATVHAALAGLGRPAAAEETSEGADKPTKRQISRSINEDYLVSFIDGKQYKMLRRHLSLHGHTPESYREAFGLPRDYPMAAASYSEKRRKLAKAIGLGRKPADKVTPAVEQAAAAVTPAKRGRKPRTIGDAIKSAQDHLEG